MQLHYLFTQNKKLNSAREERIWCV